MNQFILPTSMNAQAVVELLKKETAVSHETTIIEQMTLYDTFDWRLFAHSLALYSKGDQFTLYDMVKHETAVQATLDETPQFVWDLPPGLLRVKLAQILSIRALMPMANVVRQKTRYRILNQDEKTVAWVTLEEFSPQKENETALLKLASIQAVRGYSKTELRLARIFAQEDFKTHNEELIPVLLKAFGLKPGEYSIKLNIDLKPDMRADSATNLILRYLLQVMKMNERYIKEDIDTEILHDYRVSVRRTRSALSQIKAVFPEEKTEQFKQAFKFIGKLSNQLRDLDVYLLAEEDYKKQLPDFLKDDIHPLFEYLSSKRVDALQAVAEGLESPDYQRIMQDWELFLEEPTTDETAVNATIPILELAQQRIYKRYRRIIKDGNVILKDDQDELLHALRIECKKLRYLMEFFASLFPPDKIAQLIRQLKQLQSNLGDFNDFCVQEEYLLKVGREMPLRTKASRDALIAIGCLVGALHQRRVEVKSEFADTFNKFASSQNETMFKELFAPQKSQKKEKKGGKS
jgi:CHAD domain-containing protein